METKYKVLIGIGAVALIGTGVFFITRKKGNNEDQMNKSLDDSLSEDLTSNEQPTVKTPESIIATPPPLYFNMKWDYTDGFNPSIKKVYDLKKTISTIKQNGKTVLLNGSVYRIVIDGFVGTKWYYTSEGDTVLLNIGGNKELRGVIVSRNDGNYAFDVALKLPKGIVGNAMKKIILSGNYKIKFAKKSKN